jgi:hypothetical protein
MKYLIFILPLLFIGCATSNATVELEDNDQIAICGELDGQKQTFPTLGDLKNEGAKFLYYGPCQ